MKKPTLILFLLFPLLMACQSKHSSGGSSSSSSNEESTQKASASEKTDSTPAKKASAPTKKLEGKLNDHEWTDLGLPSGTLWATCNVGADSPTEYGDYFAWGETSPKEVYDWSTYKWCNGDADNMTKYCTGDDNADNRMELDLKDDAAYVNWGKGWRMPSDVQQSELRENCEWTWTTKNGSTGYAVKGPNGNSIFLPAAGYSSDSSLYRAGAGGDYWSRTLYSRDPSGACYLYFDSGCFDWANDSRCSGASVRPVCAAEN